MSIELCTYFDRNYLLQGLSLYRSLEMQRASFRMWILCLDDDTRDILGNLNLRHAELLTVDELIDATPTLHHARLDRSPVEFYYACTPALTAHVMERTHRTVGVSYIDADMYFFGSPAPIFEGLADANVLLVEHRLPNAEQEQLHGRYNVSLVHFAPTDEARRCLVWWQEQTLASTAMNNLTWGDQKYLDSFPERFEGVRTVNSRISGLAPWNIVNHSISKQDGQILVDGETLSVFHFAKYIFLSSRLFIPARREWIPRPILEALYASYHRALATAYREVRRVSPQYRVGYTRRNLRAALLSTAAGRTFLHGRHSPHRLGVYIPTNLTELQAWRKDRSV